MTNYIKDAHRTLSPHFYGEKVMCCQFAEALKIASTALEELDAIKKALFYGKHSEAIEIPIEGMPTCASLTQAGFEDTENLIHGVLGVATEAGELLEALQVSYLTGNPIDRVNLAEEIGDVFWYCALLCAYAGTNFENIQRMNIEKLRRRFPNAFTEQAAIVRDLVGERNVMDTFCKDE